MAKKRYAVVGVSNRSVGMFMDRIVNIYKNHAELVAMLDSDSGRMERYNSSRKIDIPVFFPDEFDNMVAQTKPDVAIVACQDCLHDKYIIDALKHDLDVISEKPLTTDEHKCAAIFAAEKASKGIVTVTFNYRYTPEATKIRELIENGKVGKVVSVDLNWYLDTYHGASYFQRWNRQREFSGGLNIHKSCHHLDLVQWWIGQKAEEVFAYGARNFYGAQGVHNPLKPEQIGDGRTCPKCDVRNKCKYYMRWFRDEFRNNNEQAVMRVIDDHIDNKQQYKNYSPRQCIFDPEIDIEDTYSAVVKYDGGAFLNYTLNGSVPYEGFRLGINGTEGRIEFKEIHAPLRLPFPASETYSPITYIPMFGGREQIDVVNLGGGHGGGDPLLCDELFIGPDPLAVVQRQADLKDGIEIVLTGLSIFKSIQQGQPIALQPLRQMVFGETI